VKALLGIPHGRHLDDAAKLAAVFGRKIAGEYVDGLYLPLLKVRRKGGRAVLVHG